MKNENKIITLVVLNDSNVAYDLKKWETKNILKSKISINTNDFDTGLYVIN